MRVREAWLRDVPRPSSDYWRQVRDMAIFIHSDGCTDAFDIYLDSCFEHDIHFRTGRTIYGQTISTRQAHRRFRYVIQSRSPLGTLSPAAWWRWMAVTLFSPLFPHKSR